MVSREAVYKPHADPESIVSSAFFFSGNKKGQIWL